MQGDSEIMFHIWREGEREREEKAAFLFAQNWLSHTFTENINQYEKITWLTLHFVSSEVQVP